MLTHLRASVLDLLLLAVAAVWGASFLAAKDLAAEVGVPAAVALRFLVAAAALGLLCLIRRERLPTGRGLAIAGVLGCSQAAVIGLETWGVHLTSATDAGLLISLALVLTPVLECAASRSWLPRSYFIAVVVAVCGVALLVSRGGFHAPGVGDLLVIAAAATRAVHVTASGRLTRSRLDGSLGVVLIQLLVCAVAFSVIAGPSLPAAAARLDPPAWGDVVFLGLLCSVFAFVVQLWAVRRTSATRASILMGTEPVWALVVGVTLAGEAIGPLGVLGAGTIIGAGYAAQDIERRHRRPSLRPGRRSGERVARSAGGPASTPSADGGLPEEPVSDRGSIGQGPSLDPVRSSPAGAEAAPVDRAPVKEGSKVVGRDVLEGGDAAVSGRVARRVTPEQGDRLVEDAVDELLASSMLARASGGAVPPRTAPGHGRRPSG